MLIWILYVSNQNVLNHRKYLKVSTLLANLGGIAKVLMIVSYIICYYFSKTQREVKIMNKIFSFEEGTDWRDMKKISVLKKQSSS